MSKEIGWPDVSFSDEYIIGWAKRVLKTKCVHSIPLVNSTANDNESGMIAIVHLEADQPYVDRIKKKE